jgi:dolichol-phosphate mannosyltransferase
MSPAYNEEEVLPFFIERAEKVCDGLVESKQINDYEILIINDGSFDGTWDIIKSNNKRNAKIKGIKFSRNFGHHNAISAGLDYVKGDFIVFLDSDLQAQPEDIPKLLEENSNGSDIVWGVAKTRDDRWLARYGSKLFYWIFNKMSGLKIPKDPVIAGISRRAANQIIRMQEIRHFSLAQWVYVGFKTSFIELEKKERFAGEIKYTFLKRMNLAIVSLVGFSKIPLKISSYIGFAMSFIGLMLGFMIVLRKLMFGVSILAGYASLFSAITFLFGMQFLILGIMGEYIGIIIDEVKRRPKYIVEEIAE